MAPKYEPSLEELTDDEKDELTEESQQQAGESHNTWRSRNERLTATALAKVQARHDEAADAEADAIARTAAAAASASQAISKATTSSTTTL